MLRTISRMYGLSIQPSQSNVLLRRFQSKLKIELIPYFPTALKAASCAWNRISVTVDLTSRFHLLPQKRHQYEDPSNMGFRNLSSGASGQSAERDETCTGYICEKREVGLCACTNDRAKRDRERRKLSPDEIKVSHRISVSNEPSFFLLFRTILCEADPKSTHSFAHVRAEAMCGLRSLPLLGARVP